MVWNPAHELCNESSPVMTMVPWHSFVLLCLGKRTSAVQIYSVFTDKYLGRTSSFWLMPQFA